MEGTARKQFTLRFLRCGIRTSSVLPMKRYIHDIVHRLLELHGLEERLETLKHDPGERLNAEGLIESLRANLPTGVLILHDQMHAKGKRSVAEVRHGVCSGCHLMLGVGNVAAIRAKDLRRCGNCGRYVYLVEENLSDTALPTKLKGKQPPRGEGPFPATRREPAKMISSAARTRPE
jgi:hypothetical protein